MDEPTFMSEKAGAQLCSAAQHNPLDPFAWFELLD